MNYLDDIALVKCQRHIRVPVTEDLMVELYDYQAGLEAKRCKQRGNGAIAECVPRCSVHRQGDDFARFHRLHHTLKYSA